MKADANTPQSKLPRRGWLAALAAAAGALTAPKALARSPLAKARAAAGEAPGPNSPSGPRPTLAVRPAPDSVKRHG
jgi:hypothetical protein